MRGAWAGREGASVDVHTQTVVTIHTRLVVASFPGLLWLQFLITCRILQAIKNWRQGRSGNEADANNQ